MEDGKIIELYWCRDEDAIAQTDVKYGQYCGSIANRILNDAGHSNECVNDTWLKAWSAIPPRRPLSLRAFLGKITRNLALNRLRDLTREKRGGNAVMLALDELEYCIPDTGTPEKALEDKEIAASIELWLQALPAEKRIAFMLRYWHFDELAVVSSKMGWSQAKTNSVLRRLRLSLKKHLEQEDINI